MTSGVNSSIVADPHGVHRPIGGTPSPRHCVEKRVRGFSVSCVSPQSTHHRTNASRLAQIIGAQLFGSQESSRNDSSLDHPNTPYDQQYDDKDRNDKHREATHRRCLGVSVDEAREIHVEHTQPFAHHRSPQ